MSNMKKTIQQKLDDTYEELKDIALELVDDLNISHELDGNYSCFIDKELYDEFRKVSDKITKLHEKQKEEDKKQLKLALK
jgi:hypothetical protein